MSNKVFIIYRERDANVKANIISALSRIWKERGYEVVSLSILEERPWEDYRPLLKEQEISYLVTLDMAGFGWSTLLEGSVYNLLSAKQLHLLTGDRGQYDMLLQKEYAINLFFFTDNPDTFLGWEIRYPLLPHLELMPGQEKLANVVDKVIEYTNTAG